MPPATLTTPSPQGIAELETAVELQDNLVYIEPPAFYYPVRETLGRAGSCPSRLPLVWEDTYSKAGVSLRLLLRNGNSGSQMATNSAATTTSQTA